MKDTANCPYCQAEEGIVESWGMSPDWWDELKRIHDKEHLDHTVISCHTTRTDVPHTIGYV